MKSKRDWDIKSSKFITELNSFFNSQYNFIKKKRQAVSLKEELGLEIAMIGDWEMTGWLSR